MAVKRLFNVRQQFFDDNGAPLDGGKLFAYVAGSTTKQDTFNSSAGSVANTNPLVLDSGGRLQAEVWGTVGVTYKLVLTTSADTDPPVSAIWDEDDIEVLNDTTVTIDQWVSGPAPTFVGTTSFTLVGDQTTVFHVGRRVRTTNSGGTIYGRITASAFTSLTTITVVNDSGVLDSGLSAVSYGLTSAANTSIPIVDEDDMASDSAILPPSQQSVKAYVDAHLFSQIGGLIQSNDGSDATNDIGITAGSCSDSTNTVILSLSSSRIKRLDASWVTGTNQGGLSSSLTISDTEYYVFIVRVAGVDDVLFDTDPDCANGIADHTVTHYRRIGWISRGVNSAGSIDLFSVFETSGGGVEYLWNTPVMDIDLSATLTTTARTDALSVPKDFSVKAGLNVYVSDASAAEVYISSPDVADGAPNFSTAPLSSVRGISTFANTTQIQVRTSSTGTIRSRSSIATADVYRVVTLGFEWSRR